MREKKVKELIGEENWDKFMHWMRGQTCGVNKDGSSDFYDCDVNAFILKIKHGYDRQQDAGEWD